MTDYSKTTNFTAKDSLPSGNANKIIKGSEFDLEFGAVQTAVGTKANKVSSATNNNILTMDANGDLQDSGASATGGVVTADLTGDVTGNADTATALATSRNFSITGDITAAAIGFTGTGNVTLTASIDAGVVDTAELATGAVTGVKLNAMTAGTEKISVYQSTITVSGAGTISTGFTKHAECRVGQSGTVRVSRTHDEATMYSRVYINGSAAAAGQGGAVTAYTDNVAVVEGDLLQIYANCSSNGCTGPDTISDLWVGIDAGIGIIGDWYIV